MLYVFKKLSQMKFEFVVNFMKYILIGYRINFEHFNLF